MSKSDFPTLQGFEQLAPLLARCHDAFAVVLPAEHSFAFKSDSRRDLLTRPRPVPLFWNWRQRGTRKSQIFQISGGYLTFDLGKSDSRSPRFEVEPRLNQQSLPLFIVSSDTTKSSLSRSRSREEILLPDGRADGQNWIEFARMAIPRTLARALHFLSSVEQARSTARRRFGESLAVIVDALRL
ncbi:hypothetical protein HN011_008291 [Eciton burchellii]|nr:hypothetical protein HN011_008291 [Eciton burchellii]